MRLKEIWGGRKSTYGYHSVRRCSRTPNLICGGTPGWGQCSENLPLPAPERAVRSPAAYGIPVCRFHGARRPETVSQGPSHPQYRHGRETLEARRNRVEAMTRIRVLTDLGVLCGFLRRRTPGPMVPWAGRPWENSYCESFNGKLRTSCWMVMSFAR